MRDTNCFVSVVLPCYRAAAVARASAITLVGQFARWGLTGEVIVVDDGGRDFGGVHIPAGARLVQCAENRGKGAAVREGIAQSKGDVVVYTDVDLPYGTAAILRATRIIQIRGFHLVLGDRWLPGSTFVAPRSRVRRVLSRLSATAVGSYVTGGFSDTQCGFKALPGPLARRLFVDFAIDGFAFEVELVHTALRLGLDIKRIPVRQETDAPSSVRVVKHSLGAIRDLIAIRQRGRDARTRYADLLRDLEASEADVLAPKQAVQSEE